MQVIVNRKHRVATANIVSLRRSRPQNVKERSCNDATGEADLAPVATREQAKSAVAPSANTLGP
jgi:hypothetical protein